MPADFFDSLLALVTKTATDLPPDVRRAMAAALAAEPEGTRAHQALSVIAQNIDQAAACDGPICQDTGMPTFEVRAPREVDQIRLRRDIERAVAEATRLGRLRPNSVDPITGRNSGDNLGPGTPIVHFEQWERDEVEVRLLLKGGGCENVNAQYALPCDLDHLGRADRTLDGVRRCILHAVWRAQGQGCSPGAAGVCIGGDRTSGYAHAKQQLFRPLDDVNPDPRLAALEADIMATVNGLDIGAMGFGGRVSLIGCKIGALNRLPASFFVSIAYDCWAFRRLGVRLDPATGALREWLYRDPAGAPSPPMRAPGAPEGFPRTGREIVLTPPLGEADVRRLRVGDVVLVTGRVYTGRDAVHAWLVDHEPPVDLRGQILYHCGPVVAKEGDGWRVTAAGPTTSRREEPYQADILRRWGVRAVIGKGGMGTRTLEALRETGAVYLNAIGGAAQFYARAVEAVEGVSLLEFGTPEAMWHLRVRDLPAIVTMDAHGHSLHEQIEAESARNLARLARA
ncbi:MAG TPA: FumA C-terminus/TtdB family hydratase beta subunit [Vicinamibacterales bacterium]|nr:FumA C-terminus/TtdB family hydratase beta subunit [Vicinamibacterales bacterium]